MDNNRVLNAREWTQNRENNLKKNLVMLIDKQSGEVKDVCEVEMPKRETKSSGFFSWAAYTFKKITPFVDDGTRYYSLLDESQKYNPTSPFAYKTIPGNMDDIVRELRQRKEKFKTPEEERLCEQARKVLEREWGSVFYPLE